MDDLNGLFGLKRLNNNDGECLSTTDVDIESTSEDTLDRLALLRLKVSEIFGKEAMYDHPFFEMKVPEHENKTPYRLACEGDRGLGKAIQALGNLSK